MVVLTLKSRRLIFSSCRVTFLRLLFCTVLRSPFLTVLEGDQVVLRVLRSPFLTVLEGGVKGAGYRF